MAAKGSKMADMIPKWMPVIDMMLRAGPNGLEVSPDPARIEAVKNYPAPVDLESLRRFLGMSEQFRDYVPDMAASTSIMRGLLRKQTRFWWSPAHQEEFEALIEVLSSPSNLSSFDLALPSFLITDAS